MYDSVYVYTGADVHFCSIMMCIAHVCTCNFVCFTVSVVRTYGGSCQLKKSV